MVLPEIQIVCFQPQKQLFPPSERWDFRWPLGDLNDMNQLPKIQPPISGCHSFLQEKKSSIGITIAITIKSSILISESVQRRGTQNMSHYQEILQYTGAQFTQLVSHFFFVNMLCVIIFLSVKISTHAHMLSLWKNLAHRHLGGRK